MDISSDSTLLASGSADKNLKIWGLDFGDCHRSLFAHGDSVMAVAFQPNTHYVFTASEEPLHLHALLRPCTGHPCLLHRTYKPLTVCNCSVGNSSFWRRPGSRSSAHSLALL